MRGNSYFFAVKQILRLQAVAIVLFSALVLVVWGRTEARSAILGGLAAFIPNAYFAAVIGKPHNTRTAKQLLSSFYAGEAIKIIMTGTLFILISQLPDILFIPLITGFIAAVMVFWFALLLRNHPV